VKCFNHNGVFKSLADVVHFYNTRNLTSVEGEVINFTLADPYGSLVGEPLFAPPEVMTNLSNAAGTLAGVGNLGLTPGEESQLVLFLQTLSDGYYSR
jgi:cytochrome c peroxidase